MDNKQVYKHSAHGEYIKTILGSNNYSEENKQSNGRDSGCGGAWRSFRTLWLLCDNMLGEDKNGSRETSTRKRLP